MKYYNGKEDQLTLAWCVEGKKHSGGILYRATYEHEHTARNLISLYLEHGVFPGDTVKMDSIHLLQICLKGTAIVAGSLQGHWETA
jgi:hypothetical protein